MKNEIFSLVFWVVTSWYQSLGLRDSDILSGVSELKLRICKVLKENVFKEKFSKKRKGVVHAIGRAQVSFPRIPTSVIYYDLVMNLNIAC